MSEVKFYRCAHCGNLVAVVEEGTCVPTCCGEPMQLLVAGSTDAATEKHVPVVIRDGAKLSAKVGEVEHPMLDAHYIQWIAVAGEGSLQIKRLHPGEAPVLTFDVDPNESYTVYEYCNLHGLWKTEA